MRAIILADALRGLRGRDRGASLFPSNPFDRVAHLYAIQSGIAGPVTVDSAPAALSRRQAREAAVIRSSNPWGSIT